MAGPSADPLSPGAVTRLLAAWNRGDDQARDSLMPLVYGELRRRAASYLRRERPGHTLRPTDLVHEAYLRLSAQHKGWQNREQFFAVAAQLMRRILVDHARAQRAAKRGRGLRVTLDEGMAGSTDPRQPDLISLDAALEELAARDERLSRLVELRFFGGLTLPETAAALAVSLATANRDWVLAKAWLYRRLARDEAAKNGRGD